ncbi:MAG: prepilin peptidase [Bdellovibrionales bacterium]|nr:prepilin peptidase [Bdellovibrionales bacterium]
MSSQWIYILPGIILFIACIDDFLTKKIHNKLILFLLPPTLLTVFFIQGLEGLKTGFLSALLALVIAVPLTLIRAIGGGDLKLLVLIALTLSWNDFLWISIGSLPWALILGLIKITLDKKLKDFYNNLFSLFLNKSHQNLQLHTIPYSIALFFSWISFLTLKRISFF